MPPSGETTVWVIRQLMGDYFCKDKAAYILKGPYRNLVVVRAEAVRTLGLEVLDDRAEFYGHANIDYGYPPPLSNDPLYSHERHATVAKYLEVANASKCVEGSQPPSAGWHGNPL